MSKNQANIFTPSEFEGRTWYIGTIQPKQSTKVANEATHDNGVSYNESTYEANCYCWVCQEAFLHN